MYEIEFTTKFRRSFKKCIKRGLDANIFKRAIMLLQTSVTLPVEYRPHK
ncbi:MAG: type II toxin-antitoxin system YafQ family toxin, partial [Prevotella salivae]|nr:type II toxin-antitoxin system YafQ family toxin [Segatella salivae]